VVALQQPATPQRASPYPSALSKAAGPSPLADSAAPNLPKGAKPSHQYQSLEKLLAQAGYAETRVITPEAVRIKERVQRLWAEEKAQAERTEAAEVERLLFQGDDSDDDDGMTAGFPPLQPLPPRIQAAPARSNVVRPPPPPPSKKKDASRDGSFGGWSIGRAQGARLLEEGPVRPLRSRGSALGLTFAAGSSATSDSSAGGGDQRSTVGAPSGTKASRHTPADDCGSLSSASSTVSSDSTMITSPPELASETFVAVRVDNSPPDYSRSFGMSSSSSAAAAADTYASSTSGVHRSSDETRSRSSKFTLLSRASSAPRPIPASAESLKDDASAAAQSLRKIASQATLRRVPSLASTSTRTVRPKKSLASLAAIAAAHPPPPPIPEVPPLTAVRKVLRHAASTPFLRSATATISPAAEAKGKAPEGWFASLSRFALARSVTEPVAPPPALRTRPSIPAFGQAMSSTSPSPASLRGIALPGQVTRHVVTCVSDEGDDLPPFAATRIDALFPEDDDDDEAHAPRTPPVLTPRAEYGEAEAWRYGGSLRSSSSSPVGGGWPWSRPTSSANNLLDQDPTACLPATPSPPSSPPPPRPLKAQRSIQSLRAALLADSAAKPPPPPVPPLPAAYVRIPIFAISSPDTVERGLPPRTLDLSDEAIIRMGKGRWSGSGSGEDDDDSANDNDEACENDDAGGYAATVDERVRRDADARGRSRKRGSTRKNGRRG